MEFEYDFVGGPFDLVVTVRGLADVRAYLDGLARLAADPRMQSARNVLFDESMVDSSSLSAADMRKIAEDSARRFESLGLSVVLVAPDALTYGLDRMWQAMAGGTLEERSIIVGSVDEAYAWLAQRTSLPDGR